MMTTPLCHDCQAQLKQQTDKPHHNLTEFAHHEASTVDGGFSEHEYRCQSCGHVLRKMDGMIIDSGWSEMPGT
ncbi:hypothetical protein [Ferrimonas marina]|nr:hypothetical protein [Ferrimonas marina]